jgi:ribosome-associated protein
MIGIEGDDKAEWILVDFGDVIVHIMLPATREFYDIERLWSVRPNDADED